MNIRTTYCAIALIGGLIALGAPDKEVTERRWISFEAMPLEQVLQVYADFTGSKLFIDSRVRRLRAKITWTNEDRISKSEAIRMIEKAILDQSAVIITRLDTNRVSVSFNDALPTKSVADGEPK